MLKRVALVLSIVFISVFANADTKFIKNATCRFQGKNYVLLHEQSVGLRPNVTYAILEKDTQTPQKMARTLQGSFQAGSKDLQFPLFWRPTSIPLSTCSQSTRSFHIYAGDVIREFYVKTYFISGDPRSVTEDIEVLVKRGEAIPLKVRVICKSDELTDDVTLCNEVTIVDKIIPIDPNEP